MRLLLFLTIVSVLSSLTPGVGIAQNGIIVKNHCDATFVSDIGPEFDRQPDGTIQTVTRDCTGQPGCNEFFDMALRTGDQVFLTFCQNGGTVDFDTGLSVWSGNPQFDLLQACVDDSCGFASELTFTALSDDTFRFRVGGFGGASGRYTLALSAPPGSVILGAHTSSRGRLVYLGIDVSDARHAPNPEAHVLAGNAARWAGRKDDPAVGYVEGGGEFDSEVGTRLTEAGLGNLTELPASSLAAANLAPFDILYFGPTTEVSFLVLAASNIASFSHHGGGLVVEPNVLDPESWTWVPLADGIGHSGAVNRAQEDVFIRRPDHPLMQGITEDGLSNWGMSIHSTFNVSGTAGFEVLAADQIQFGDATIIVRDVEFFFRDGFESGDTSGWSLESQ